MQSVFSQVLSKITLNKDGNIKKSAFVKDLISKENVFNIPIELMKFEPFLKNEEHNYNWVDCGAGSAIPRY